MTTPSSELQAQVTLSLDDVRAVDPATAGSKAAALAVARRGGIPVLPGFVIATSVHAAYLAANRSLPAGLAAALEPAWAVASRDGSRPLVVRSSSTVEDIGASSMAGRFTSVLDVRGWPAFLDAVDRVLASADRVAGPEGPSPLGVLVQEFLVPRCGGVMFGVDPVTGDDTHVVIEAVVGGPDALVGGRVDAQHYRATRRGRLVSVDHRTPGPAVRDRGDRLLSRGEVRALVRLAARARDTFGADQDVEWAITADDQVLLLQSRPVTATSAPGPGGACSAPDPSPRRSPTHSASSSRTSG